MMPQPSAIGASTPSSATRKAVPPTPHQLGRLHFQADAKKQEHDSEFGKGSQYFIGLNPAEYARSDDCAREDLAHDSRLAETFEHLRKQLGGAEHNQHCQRYRDRVGVHADSVLFNVSSIKRQENARERGIWEAARCEQRAARR